MLRSAISRLTRILDRGHVNPRRQNRQAAERLRQHVERLELRQLMTAQFTGNFGAAASLHDVTITLTNDGPQMGTLNAADANRANFDVVIVGPTPPAGFHGGTLDFRIGSVTVPITGLPMVNGSVSTFTFSVPNVPVTADMLNSLPVSVLRAGTPFIVRTSPILAAPQLRLAVTDDSTAPVLTSLSAVSSPRNMPVASLTATLNDPIAAATFTTGNVSLTRNGSNIPLSITRTPLSGNSSSITINDLTTETTADGNYVLTVTTTGVGDAAGNAAIGTLMRSWTMDTTPPAPASAPVLDSADDTGRFNTDGITSQRSGLTFTGTAEAGSSVTVRLTRGADVIMQVATLIGTTFNATFAGLLAEGTYMVDALSADALNNMSTSAAATLVIDATAPAILAALDLATTSDTAGSHIVGDDDLTSDTTPTFTVSGAELNAMVTLVRDGSNDTESIPTPGTSITATASAVGLRQFSAFQTDVAGNSSTVSTALAVAIDTATPRVTNVQLTSSLPSQLRVPITTSTRPTVRFNLTDEIFGGKTNAVRLQLVKKVGVTETVLTTRTTTIATHNVAQPETLTPDEALASGEHKVFVRAMDAAGNSMRAADNSADLAEFNFFISQPGADTTDSPGTPVLTETFFIGSKFSQASAMGLLTVVVDREIPVGFPVTINNEVTPYYVVSSSPHALGTQLTLNRGLTAAVAVAELATWLRPWQQTFDRTTQTIWFTNEDGSRLGQLDPATSQVKLFDISLAASNGGFPSPTSVDPHGVFFDFDTHITPRVWFVYRNTESVSDSTGTLASGSSRGRVAYLDLGTGQLVTMQLKDLVDEGNVPINLDFITQPHATFVDARGHLWISVEDSKTLIELDFDQLLDGTLNPTLNMVTAADNSRSGRAIVHDIPDTFASTLQPHGLGTVVDDRTGEPYIYFTDGNNNSLGRVYLLKPGTAATGNVDQWIEWDFDAALRNESRLASPSGHALFLAIDDHETPGLPEDDTILVSDPGRGLNNTAGAIRELNPQALIEALRTGTALPATSVVRTVRIPKIPGATAGQAFSSPQLPFNDREGNVFFVDALGSVGRFNFDDALLDPLRNDADGNASNDSQDESSINAPINSATTTATLFAANLVSGTAPLARLTATTTVLSTSGRDDRAQGNGVDQYEVAQSSSRNRSEGSFRGFLNAANVVSGSLSQSDTISTTVFAETARKQMTVVADPTALPTGAIAEGRLAFQVARNGSLIMTSRQHGELLDRQRNLSRERIIAGEAVNEVTLDGDASAVTDADGNVHVFGKNTNGDVVEFRFSKTANSWSTHLLELPPLDTVLAGEPTAFIDKRGRVSALINTSDGHVLLYRTDGTAPLDLTALSGGAAPIFASVDVVEETASDTLFVYGVNQAGGVVEYRFSTIDALPTVVTAVTIAVTPAAGQTDRDVRILQSLSAVTVGSTRHIFGTDGHSRLVHLEVTGAGTANGENVTELTKAAAAGYFDSFQQEFAARVYPDISVLVDAAGRIYVYGTNGLDLVEFTRTGTTWTAGNLTNDITKGGPERIPANKVFGAPGAYITANGDRHIFQINADSEVIEYAFLSATSRFNTQNINLARGNSITALQSLNADVAPRLNVPEPPVSYVRGSSAVLLTIAASVTDSNAANLQTLQVRTVNGGAEDRLAIRSHTLPTGDRIAVSGMAITINGAALGAFQGGLGPAPLIVTLEATASVAQLAALLNSLEFATSAASPIGIRLVEFRLKTSTSIESDVVAKQVIVDDTDPFTNPLTLPLL